ncbi:hypothetical protein [Paenibacillus thiaminolyticus]|uniref:hypothetical protein n=1 Tax=Paenibacillus thiaminolyticus TaxID=49283 RepID=UPI001F0F4320|nr:hypothetical protein [Paenibacillus thiaminolyticus]
MQERILTGDRVTGKLHLGHYAGSLKNRVELQHQFDTYLILADVQALTTHFEHPELLQNHLRNVALDYLAAGIDPEKARLAAKETMLEVREAMGLNYFKR